MRGSKDRGGDRPPGPFGQRTRVAFVLYLNRSWASEGGGRSLCVGKKKAGRVRGPPSANAKCELRKKDRRLFDGLGVFEGQARIEILNCIELFFVNALIDVERVGDYRRAVDGAQAITFFPHLEGFFET